MIDSFTCETIHIGNLHIGWDQSSKFVKIYVSSVPGLVGITEENVTATFGDK